MSHKLDKHIEQPQLTTVFGEETLYREMLLGISRGSEMIEITVNIILLKLAPKFYRNN